MKLELNVLYKEPLKPGYYFIFTRVLESYPAQVTGWLYLVGGPKHYRPCPVNRPQEVADGHFIACVGEQYEVTKHQILTLALEQERRARASYAHNMQAITAARLACRTPLPLAKYQVRGEVKPHIWETRTIEARDVDEAIASFLQRHPKALYLAATELESIAILGDK